MISQQEKGEQFRALHSRDGCFVIPNPWDAGSAKILESMGFEALATTSGGLAFSLGRSDGRGLVSRTEALANVETIVAASDLPVSADLENGYHDEPAGVAETIQLAGRAGLVGGSIEDATGNPDDPIYDIALAAEKIVAAAESARALAAPFVLTARAENYLHGRADLKDTIARLQAYQEAGADVLYAPGLRTLEDIKTLVSAVDKPVNVIMGIAGVSLTLEELTGAGVRRISLGSTLNRTALGAFMAAAREILGEGTFSYGERAAGSAELDAIFGAAND